MNRKSQKYLKKHDVLTQGAGVTISNGFSGTEVPWIPLFILKNQINNDSIVPIDEMQG